MGLTILTNPAKLEASPQPPVNTKPKVDLSRKTILATGLSLLDQKGAKFSVRAVADQLGVQLNAVQHHLKKGAGSLERQIVSDVLASIEIPVGLSPPNVQLRVMFWNLHKKIHHRPNLSRHVAHALAQGPIACPLLAERLVLMLQAMGRLDLAGDLYRLFEHLSAFAIDMSVANNEGLKGSHLKRFKGRLTALDPAETPSLAELGASLLSQEKARVRAWSLKVPDLGSGKRAARLLLAELGIKA